MIEFQQKLIGDKGRNQAFYKALEKVVKEGSTVSDIGSGTGFLSFLAIKLGAKECHLYESDPAIIDLSARIAKENRMNKCYFYETLSTEMIDPVKTDIVLSETLGNFAYEEHIIETMNDAHRFLKKDGVMIPQKLDYFVSPIFSPRIFEEINVWDKVGFDLNFSKIRKVALNCMYVKTVRSDDLMSKNSAKVWDRIDFRVKNSSKRIGKAEWQIEKDGVIYGLALWWDCELIAGITISTSPFAKATHWEQIFLPLQKPFAVKKGETISAEIRSDTRLAVGVEVDWEVRKV